MHLNDLLARRTRLALVDPCGGIGDGSIAGDVMAAEAGWSESELIQEVEAHRIAIEKERGLALPTSAPDESPTSLTRDAVTG